MTDTNKKPLWQRLNEQRTKGEQVLNGSGDILVNGKCIGSFYMKEEDAQYSKLATDNLHIIAEALETLLEFTDKKQVGYKAAKDALSKIS